MQLRDTGPALTFCGNILWNPEASLYHMTRNIYINFTVHWLKHLVSTLLRSFWNENTSSGFWLIIKIKRLTMNCVVLETMYWFPTSKSYELLTTRATGHTLGQSLEQSQAPSHSTNLSVKRGQLSHAFLFIPETQFQHTHFGGSGGCQILLIIIKYKL